MIFIAIAETVILLVFVCCAGVGVVIAAKRYNAEVTTLTLPADTACKVSVVCPKCKVKLLIPTSSGKNIRCPKCKYSIPTSNVEDWERAKLSDQSALNTAKRQLRARLLFPYFAISVIVLSFLAAFFPIPFYLFGQGVFDFEHRGWRDGAPLLVALAAFVVPGIWFGILVLRKRQPLFTFLMGGVNSFLSIGVAIAFVFFSSHHHFMGGKSEVKDVFRMICNPVVELSAFASVSATFGRFFSLGAKE